MRPVCTFNAAAIGLCYSGGGNAGKSGKKVAVKAASDSLEHGGADEIDADPARQFTRRQRAKPSRPALTVVALTP